MTRNTNNAEGGTNGTTVTSANSGGVSGTAWDSITIGTGAALTYSNAFAQDTLSYKFTNVSGAANYLRWDFTTSDMFYVSFYMYIPVTWTVATEIFNMRTSAGGTSARMILNTSGRLALLQESTTMYTTPNNTLPAGEWIFVEAGINRTSVTNAPWVFRGIQVSTGTELWNQSGTIATTTTNYGQARIGKMSGTAASDIYLDNITVDTGKYTLEGLPVPVQDPPVASVAAPSYNWALIDATSSTPGEGGTLSYTISPSTDVYEVEVGKWIVPASSLASETYTVTVTEDSTSLTATGTSVVVRPVTYDSKRFNGTAWV